MKFHSTTLQAHTEPCPAPVQAALLSPGLQSAEVMGDVSDFVNNLVGNPTYYLLHIAKILHKT